MIAMASRLRSLERAALGLIALFLAVGLHRVFITNINWDEFYYLSLVHLYRSGDLALKLQTLHVHFFSWLAWVSENEVRQIFAARMVIWLASAASAGLIYRIARRFSSRLGALFAAVFYLSFSFVMDHGLSFRADPFCALFFLIAVHLLVNKADRPYATPLAALAMAVAVMFSLKSIFYAPTLAVLLVALPSAAAGRWAGLRRAAIFTLSFAITATALFLWHSADLAPAPLTSAGAYAAAAGRKTLAGGTLMPAWPFVRQALINNALTWIFIAGGLWIAGRRWLAGGRRAEAIVILSLALPLVSLLVYRNAFPYFFVFLMPTAVIPAALAIDRLAARAGAPDGRAVFAALAVTLVMAATTYAINYARKWPDQTVAQAEIVRLVHTLFPRPVPYIDRNAMIASFPKAGFFMSTWGMESYRAAKRPIMADLIARKAPPLLIVNTPALDISRPAPPNGVSSPYNLFPADFKVLRENYIRHWGAIYVAGKRLDLAADASARTFEIMVPGTYTLEADGPVVIDGAPVTPGAYVELARGPHSAAAAAGAAQQVTLRWGKNLFVPARSPSPQPIYTGF